MKTIEFVTYEDIKTLAELACLGHYVLNNYRREARHEKHEEMYKRIAEVFKAETLKLYPEKKLGLEDDDLLKYCDAYAYAYDTEHITDVIATALQSYKTKDYHECRDAILSLFKGENLETPT